jgi:hypothetical protein
MLSNAESVRHVRINPFRVKRILVMLIPGLKQPWAEISQQPSALIQTDPLPAAANNDTTTTNDTTTNNTTHNHADLLAGLDDSFINTA